MDYEKMAKDFNITEIELDQLSPQLEQNTGHSGKGAYGHYIAFLNGHNHPELLKKVKGYSESFGGVEIDINDY